MQLVTLTQVKDQPVTQVDQSRNLIFVIDCSGSMSSDLREIRKQLKNKLSSIVKEQDTVTILWFSGRNESGILKDHVKINNALDLKTLHDAIDRFLVPVGLTSFVDPLKQIDTFITKEDNYSLFFVTDGCDNQNSKANILEVCNKIKDKLTQVVIVEFGYYCDSKMLKSMAEELNGTVIFSEEFENYDVSLENFVKSNSMSIKKIELVVSENTTVAYSINNGTPTTYKIENNKILVSENIDKVICVVPNEIDTKIHYSNIESVKDVLGAIYICSQKGMSDEVYSLLGSIGDVELIQSYTNSFGKQDINKFNNLVLDKLNGTSPLFAKGQDFDFMPDPNVYCVMNLISDLMLDTDAKIHISHEEFNYERTTTKMVDANQYLTESEQEKLNHIKDVNLLQQEIERLKNNKQRFEALPNQTVNFSKLTWNEDRANLSVSVDIFGNVILSKEDQERLGLEKIPSKEVKNYLLIKDSKVHLKKLPMTFSEKTFKILKDNKVLNESTYDPNQVYVIDLSKMNVVNRSMLKNFKMDSNTFFKMNWELNKNQFKQKVLNFYLKQFEKQASKALIEAYGEVVAKELDALGIKEYGYAPKRNSSKSGDELFIQQFACKMESFNTIPKIEDVIKKISVGKNLTPSDSLVSEYLTEFESISNNEKLLNEKSKEIKKEVKEGIKNLAYTKFLMTVGQKWFTDSDSFGESSATLDLDGKTINFTATLKDGFIKI